MNTNQQETPATGTDPSLEKIVLKRLLRLNAAVSGLTLGSTKG